MLELRGKIQDFKLIKNNEHYLVLYNEHYFSIKKLFYEILQDLKTGVHKQEEFINDYNISIADYEELTALLSDQISDIIENTKKKNKYIKLSIKILSERHVAQLSTYFSFLFHKAIFRVLFPLLTVLAIITAFFISIKFRNHTAYDISVLDTFWVYVVILIIMFFHELGHSSASKHFGVNPKEIGFGFYIIFPVLFSNVTRIWELNKNQRVMVNLGGVYFQGILVFLAFVYLLFTKQESYFTYLVILITKTNIFVMAYSMFPFVRNDGYWIVSDYFNIANLNEKSYSYIFKLLQNRHRINYALLVYSLGQYAFVFYLCYSYLPSIPENISAFINYIKANGVTSLLVNELGLLLKLVFSLLIGGVAASSLLKFVTPMFKQKTNHA